MATVTQINSTTFTAQGYEAQDINVVPSASLNTSFDVNTDVIEFYALDTSQNIIYGNENHRGFSVVTGSVVFNPDENLDNEGYNEGEYLTLYNFYRKHLNSSNTERYYISEISGDRTEIRLASTTIENEDIISSTNEFVEYRNSKDYFVDFYLNFGRNKRAIANNVALNLDENDNPTVLIKLYEPLAAQYSINTQLWVVEELSLPQAYRVNFPFQAIEETDFEFISGPNFNLDITTQVGESSETFSLSTLAGNNVSSSTQQLNSLLANQGIEINVNFEDYKEFVNFSSARTRLDNFVYKAGLIESSSNEITKLDNSITNIDNVSDYSASKAIHDAVINTTITNFDSYEYFLYYNSGSKWSWPKSTTQQPYTLYSTGSSQVENWLDNIRLSASNYDTDNQNYLFNVIPEYLRDDPANANYEIFVDMLGQHYDSIWTYTKDVTNKFSADNRLDYGISKDLVADAIRDFGVKLYSNNFNNQDLYQAFLGIGENDEILSTVTGSENIDTFVSASTAITPLDSANKRLYKRLYHNLPYLLKTKGTAAGLKALITSFGIPDTILRVKEFGGQDDNIRDYSQEVFNYAFDSNQDEYIETDFALETDWNAPSNRPETIMFRFKTVGTEPYFASQSLFSLGSDTAIMTLEHTGSLNTSGSYTGSIVSPYNEYGTLSFYPQTSNTSQVASVDLPFYNGDWWSVMLRKNGNNYTLTAANKSETEIQRIESASVTSGATIWAGASTANIPASSNAVSVGSNSFTRLSGSYQELRYYSNEVSVESFKDFVLNPSSYQDGSINSTPDNLAFRLALGNELQRNLTSIHPKSSQLITSSFALHSTGSYSTTLTDDNFSSNNEVVVLNQVSTGIRNRVSDKIKIVEEGIPGDALSSFRSLVNTSPTGSFTPNVQYAEVAFSPQDQINDDITGQLGNFNIGDYIGDPRNAFASEANYPDLDRLRDSYFEKYTNSYDVKDFVRLIKFLDNSLFKMIKDFTPAQTSLTSGVVVKQHLLERNKLRTVTAGYQDDTYSGSVLSAPNEFSEDPLHRDTGGSGGTFGEVNNIENSPEQEDGTRFQLTQSWGEIRTSVRGLEVITRDEQTEFYNGVFGGPLSIEELQRRVDRGEDLRGGEGNTGGENVIRSNDGFGGTDEDCGNPDYNDFYVYPDFLSTPPDCDFNPTINANGVTQSIEVETPVLVGPTVTISTSYTQVPCNSTVSLTATYNDPDGTVDSISWSTGDTSTPGLSSGTDTITYTGGENITTAITVTVTDNDGRTDTDTIYLTFLPCVIVEHDPDDFEEGDDVGNDGDGNPPQPAMSITLGPKGPLQSNGSRTGIVRQFGQTVNFSGSYSAGVGTIEHIAWSTGEEQDVSAATGISYEDIECTAASGSTTIISVRADRNDSNFATDTTTLTCLPKVVNGQTLYCLRSDLVARGDNPSDYANVVDTLPPNGLSRLSSCRRKSIPVIYGCNDNRDDGDVQTINFNFPPAGTANTIAPEGSPYACRYRYYGCDDSEALNYIRDLNPGIRDIDEVVHVADRCRYAPAGCSSRVVSPEDYINAEDFDRHDPDACIPRVRGCGSIVITRDGYQCRPTNYDESVNDKNDDDCICPRRGCTNPNASNYDPNAQDDDGSCILPEFNNPPTVRIVGPNQGDVGGAALILSAVVSDVEDEPGELTYGWSTGDGGSVIEFFCNRTGTHYVSVAVIDRGNPAGFNNRETANATHEVNCVRPYIPEPEPEIPEPDCRFYEAVSDGGFPLNGRGSYVDCVDARGGRSQRTYFDVPTGDSIGICAVRGSQIEAYNSGITFVPLHVCSDGGGGGYDNTPPPPPPGGGGGGSGGNREDEDGEGGSGGAFAL